MGHQKKWNSARMWTPLGLLQTAALFASAAGVCQVYEKDYYADIGCKPAATGTDGCPISYDCSSLSSRSQSKCHYQGKEYDEGLELEEGKGDECLAACRCTSTYPDKKMAFVCAHVECPEVFNGPPPPGCYRTYEHGKCCHVKVVCASDESAEQKTSKSICQYKTNVYQVGERFYPEEEPCLSCICQPGFNGSFIEPFCKKINCKLELVYGQRIADGCIPVYYGENDCCPIDWRCPDKSDTVVQVPGTKDSSKSELQCQFGDVKMQVGDKLSPSSLLKNTECECRVPPHPICIQKAYE